MIKRTFPRKVLLCFFIVIATTLASARPSVIIIDPGHGGFDRGGIPGLSVAEKDLTLDTAKRLSRILRARGDVKVVMTRQDDTFIPLPVRTSIANQYAGRNAVFVSIHFNAGLREGAFGIETYYYNPRAFPLTVRVHRRVIKAADSIDRGIRRRGYWVLRANRLPAILVECGFMTNRAEKSRIQNVRYRERIARAIAEGLMD
jgi:N-acetylmuramoyl-L-alanine amidase